MKIMATPPRVVTPIPTQRRNIRPTTAAKAEAGVRREIAMAGAQTRARGRSATLAGAGTGCCGGIAVAGGHIRAQGRRVSFAAAETGGRNEPVAPRRVALAAPTA